VLSAHPGQVAGAATNNAELAAHQSERPGPSAPPINKLLSGRQRSSRPGRTQFHVGDNGFSYVKNRSLRELLVGAGLGHLTTEPYRPRTNGRVERFHQTMAREWAYGLSYRSHRQRN
jgi:hypothetical protein